MATPHVHVPGTGCPECGKPQIGVRVAWSEELMKYRVSFAEDGNQGEDTVWRVCDSLFDTRIELDSFVEVELKRLHRKH